MKKITGSMVKEWNSKLNDVRTNTKVGWSIYRLQNLISKGIIYRRYSNKKLRGEYNYNTSRYDTLNVTSTVLKFAYGSEDSFYDDPNKMIEYIDSGLKDLEDYRKYLEGVRKIIEENKEIVIENNMVDKL